MPDDKMTPLVSHKSLMFYDLDCMLNVSTSLANGYIVILAGGAPKESVLNAQGCVVNQPIEKEADNIVLGFLALTEGNVIDSCFGVSPVTSKMSSSRKYVERLKSLLLSAADENDDIRRLAVDTYIEIFGVLLQYQGQLRNLNCFTRCFRYGRLRRQAQANLERVFETLKHAIQTCTRLEI
ncbi:hypothetical protein MPSEU_000558300 [Mayamaea pseudoterrestris]|nr:hypothetical protein MPSEU_000558300 [Mayamaea pseudoterrestris]